jgi:hypothetical protein
MDGDLKQHLNAMEARLDASMEARINQAGASLETRITQALARQDASMEERMNQALARQDASAETRMNDAFGRFSQHLLHEMSLRLDEIRAPLASIDARLTLQAGLIQGGARAIARFSKFSESSEKRWVDLTKRMGALERKVEDLGGRGA